MRSFFDDLAFLQYNDFICIPDGAQAMGYYERGSIQSGAEQ